MTFPSPLTRVQAPVVADDEAAGLGYNEEGVDVLALHIALPCVRNDTGCGSFVRAASCFCASALFFPSRGVPEVAQTHRHPAARIGSGLNLELETETR